MSDIFQEVDEEVRREQLKRLWDRYGLFIIAAVVLIAVGVAGWQWYQRMEADKAAASGAQFEAAAQLSEQGKSAEAQAAFAQIAKDGTAGYRALARLREAAELVQRDPKAAIDAYDKLAADTGADPALRDLAALRAGMQLVDTASYDEVRKRLEPLAEASRPFRHTAREYLVLAAWRAGDNAAAKKWAEMMQIDPETPPGTRSRVEIILALFAGNGKS